MSADEERDVLRESASEAELFPGFQARNGRGAKRPALSRPRAPARQPEPGFDPAISPHQSPASYLTFHVNLDADTALSTQ